MLLSRVRLDMTSDADLKDQVSSQYLWPVRAAKKDSLFALLTQQGFLVKRKLMCDKQ